MDTSAIIEDFKTKVCKDIAIEAEGINRFKIVTPFSYGDGDHFVIFLKVLNEGNAFLTDEGHTLMHLSYQGFNFWEGQRGEILEQIKTQFQVNDNEGKLELQVPGNQYGDALFSYIQAIQKITDVEFLTQERVRTTFMEDFRALISKTIADEKKLVLGYVDKANDPNQNYPVDICFLNSRPVHFYGIYNDDKCQFATINILKFREWYTKGRPKPIGIFENQAEIRNRVLARFTDVGHKTFSSISVADKDLKDYLLEEGALKE